MDGRGSQAGRTQGRRGQPSQPEPFGRGGASIDAGLGEGREPGAVEAIAAVEATARTHSETGVPMVVTLKGPVRTEEEKQRIEAKATDIAGTGHVTNQLSVAPERGAKPKA